MEKFQDALRSYDKFRKLSNARFSAARLLRPKDYVAGKAYLRWNYSILHPGGDRYEATLLACRTEAVPKGGPPSSLERDGYVHRLFDGDEKPVFVGEIEPMHSEEGPIRSAVWLYLTHKVRGELPGAGLENILLQPGFEVRLRFPDGEVGVFLITIVGDRARSDQMVQRRPEVMDSVAGYEGETWGERPFADHVAITLRNWIELWPGGIHFATEEGVGGRIKLLDMGFCPMKL